MAVLAAAAIVPTLTSGLGVVGAAVVGAGVYAAAGYLDSTFIMPALLGEGRAQAQPNRLLGVPVGSNEPGAPRVVAIGKRVRVPTHILWQAEKVRQTSASSSKSGTNVPQRKVLITAAVALNDRKTIKLDRLVGNDLFLIGGDRNLVQVDSDAVAATESGGTVTITVASLDDPDFTDRFAVGDFIQCRGFDVTAGGSVNVGQLEVLTVTSHGAATPSSMTARPCAGQSMTGLVANGGAASDPATVERVDDAIINHASVATPDGSGWSIQLDEDPRDVFAVDDRVRLSGWKHSITGASVDMSTSVWKVRAMSDAGGGVFFIGVLHVSGPPSTAFATHPDTIESRSTSDQARIEFESVPAFASGLFPSTFDPLAYYHDGSEDQAPDSLMEANIGVDNVSAYRGVAYQVLDQFVASQFGDSLPFQLEAVISVDEGLTWAGALVLVTERGGVSWRYCNTLGVTPRPFEGFFMRGAVTGVTNLFPLLIAGQITTQERDGVICFQDTDAADVVQIENGAQFSDLGAYVGQEDSPDSKLRFTHATREDLPTSIGIRHQDPDNAYADGYQHFGLRNPSGVDHENRQELDLSNLVMTRKQARNLAGTLMRRAWVNGTQVELTLPAAYCDLLEGDLLTVTDDSAIDHTMRVLQRDIGTNFLVKIVAAIEELDLAVTGSPVQAAAGLPPGSLIVPPVVQGIVLDVPPLDDTQAFSPGFYVGATGTGGTWSGVSVFMSKDSETTWTPAGFLGGQCTAGTMTTALPAASPAETYGSATLTYDLANFIAVDFDSVDAYGFQQLGAIGAAVEGGIQWFQVIAPDGTYEILGAAYALQTGERTFLLGSFLRGLRGTWHGASLGMPAGSRVVMLDQAGGEKLFVGLNGPQTTGVNISLRFVPQGLSLADVQSVSLVPTWRNAAPFDPRVLTKTIGGSPFDVRFTTENWSRLNLPLGALAPYPLDETFEAYRFTIYDPAGSAIKRTKTISAAGSGAAMLRDRFVDYTAAEQTADGYTPSGSTSFYVSVQQLGTYGESRQIKRLV